MAATSPPPRPGRPPAYRGLPRPVQLAVWVCFGLVVGAVLGATLSEAVRLVGATATMAPGKLAWYAARVTGFLAYFAVAGSVVYGLLLSTKLLDAIAHRPVSFALHKDLALVGVALSGLHGLVLLGDHTYPFTPAAILIPFASPYAPTAVGIGQIAFYLVVLVTASFYVRRQIGQRSWRLIHYVTFLAFAGAAAHGIAAGTDSGASWAAWIYVVPHAAVVFFFAYRLVISIAARRSPARTRPAVERNLPSPSLEIP
jgi:methionine sulfoxide reductase heme-binding subunit